MGKIESAYRTTQKSNAWAKANGRWKTRNCLCDLAKDKDTQILFKENKAGLWKFTKEARRQWSCEVHNMGRKAQPPGSSMCLPQIQPAMVPGKRQLCKEVLNQCGWMVKSSSAHARKHAGRAAHTWCWELRNKWSSSSPESEISKWINLHNDTKARVTAIQLWSRKTLHSVWLHICTHPSPH